MKYGWLIVNQFLLTDKFNEIYKWLQDSAAKYDCKLDLKTNAELLCTVNNGTVSSLPCISNADAPSFILFWDKDIRLARALEHHGFRLFNSADAIEACDDKSLTFSRLAGTGISMPKTITAPMTFSNIGYTDLSFLATIEDMLVYPMVVKECFGSFGMQVYLVNNREQLLDVFKKVNGRPILFQEFISESYGRDIRINMVDGNAVATMLRHHDSDFRANITGGGHMERYTPTSAQLALAKSVCNTLCLDFAGIDILFGKNEEPILCEVNSNAHFKNIFDCTGVNVADKIMEYILKQLI